MSKVAIFFFTLFGHFYVFDRKFDKGHSHLTKLNFDSVEISSFLITFYGGYFVCKVYPYSKMKKKKKKKSKNKSR